ncbi:TPA_asm: hypothetical protein GZK48_08485 [Listeria monocytogenes]|uniref:hypothetical protein n=1 Tax=Listeria monocytogenes TaxID=1639 RepID=UPI000442D03C|nr:hypothetical protein [Listeria monocytogenes]EAA0101424.1 hypothetical protein [Listeria monocytogenes]EAC2321218.1 hypothetical protein [Listeria monocytogenes]EAC2668109.1 hypothetical protein [Listeria monocytogenes]EAC2738435.1 hypothetical protein [Listeria monocytogenes]EAC3227254.1 hypothetical protein [Listeria monocytogenes]
MKQSKTSEAQRRAADNWDAKNAENRRYRVAKSSTKRFITKMATTEDLAQVKAWLDERNSNDDGQPQ